jgi:hypothetical protein
VIDEMRRRLGHASTVTGGADAASLAREGNEKVVTAGTAPRPGKPEAEDAAAEVRPKLLLDMHRHGMVTEAPLGEPGLEVPGGDRVEGSSLGAAAGVLLGLAERRAGLCPHGRTCRWVAEGDHGRARLAAGPHKTPLSLKRVRRPKPAKRY